MTMTFTAGYGRHAGRAGAVAGGAGGRSSKRAGAGVGAGAGRRGTPEPCAAVTLSGQPQGAHQVPDVDKVAGLGAVAVDLQRLAARRPAPIVAWH